MLIQGETVTVIHPIVIRDELGEPTESEPSRETLDNVVVVPGGTQDLDSTRPEGVTVALTLHIPKTYQTPLKGCTVEVRGTEYSVIGDPQYYTEANTPGPWNMTVEVSRVDG